MIKGMHALLYSTDEVKSRAFFRDVMQLPYIDTGGGWLIFDAPAGDLGVHPGDRPMHAVSFFCDDIHQTVAELEGRGARFTQPVSEEEWGFTTMVEVPGAGEVQIYQPKYGKG
jgi:hypothetical protein